MSGFGGTLKGGMFPRKGVPLTVAPDCNGAFTVGCVPEPEVPVLPPELGVPVPAPGPGVPESVPVPEPVPVLVPVPEVPLFVPD